MITKHYVNFPVNTTMELLMCDTTANGAILKYNDKVVAVDMNWTGIFEAAIYESISGGKIRSIEQPIKLVEILEDTYEDSGHAVMAAMEKVGR